MAKCFAIGPLSHSSSKQNDESQHFEAQRELQQNDLVRQWHPESPSKQVELYETAPLDSGAEKGRRTVRLGRR